MEPRLSSALLSGDVQGQQQPIGNSSSGTGHRHYTRGGGHGMYPDSYYGTASLEDGDDDDSNYSSSLASSIHATVGRYLYCTFNGNSENNTLSER